MKFSEQWLREWVNPNKNSCELAEQFTMHGLEIAAVNPVAADFSGVVVGEVLDVQPHPNADRLQLCRVDVGQAEGLSIVCGAKNVRQGMKAAVAIIGAQLPGLKIKRSKIRGVESQGMLCSTVELGIEESTDGIISLSNELINGKQIREVLDLNDKIFEVELTPNRGDCLSISGLAREVAVINRCQLNEPLIKSTRSTLKDELLIEILPTSSCRRYCGRIIRGINAKAKTPKWMRDRLNRSEINTISPVVDVTNYVLLELGQPLHAFDLAKLHGGIHVRLAAAEEKIVLLDGKEIALTPGATVIADEQRPLALAGIMGGTDSAVGETTNNLLLESAFFDPIATALTARSYGIHTDSSHRFERGVDPGLQIRAIERATQLLLDIVGGNAGSVCEARDEKVLAISKEIVLRRARIEQLLGITIEDQEVVDILQRLGMQTREIPDGWEVTTPSFRFDLHTETDLIEELVRIYGYDRVPAAELKADLTMQPCSEQKLPLHRIRSLLVDSGYHEVITYSFIDKKLQKLLNPTREAISVRNPIATDMSVMRTTLWPGLIATLLYNTCHQQQHMRLFESGICFIQEESVLTQRSKLAGLIYGDNYPEQWGVKSRTIDFYDLKGDVERLLLLSGCLDYKFVVQNHSALHPGRSAAIFKQNNMIGWLGALHPQIISELHIQKDVYLFELELPYVYNALVPSFNVFSKYPHVRRDIAIVADEKITAEDIVAKVSDSGGKLLRNVQIFDIYRGEGIEENQKSLAISLLYQDNERTLVDEEIEQNVANILAQLKSELNITMRG